MKPVFALGKLNKKDLYSELDIVLVLHVLKGN